MDSSHDPRTDGELLLSTGTDPEAFAVFYRRHVRGVLSFFRRRAGDAEAAFDLTAETFAAALEASPRYQPRPEPARGWLYGIAWNKLYEAQRRGHPDDAACRSLGMTLIPVSDAGLARIEVLAGGRALRRLESLPARPRPPVRTRVLDVALGKDPRQAALLAQRGQPARRRRRADHLGAGDGDRTGKDDPIATLERRLVSAARHRGAAAMVWTHQAAGQTGARASAAPTI